MTEIKPQTARHFPVGTRVSHSEFGLGVVHVRDDGQHYVRFDNGATGTPYTRVIAAK